MAGQHTRPSSGKVRRYGGAAALAAAAVVAVVAINQTSGGITHEAAGAVRTEVRQASHTTGTSPDAQKLASTVQITPASGTGSVAPDSVVTVASPSATLTSVQVSAGPAQLAGVTTDGHTWRSSAGLVAGASYQVAATVTDRSGGTATVTSTFQTMAVRSAAAPTITPADGTTVGVGQPLVLKFPDQVPAAAQASLLSHLSVAETIPVPGGWHWFSGTELHLRPQAFWPTGEHLTLTADLDGWDVGDGTWGSGTSVTHVSIGDSHVSVANLQTEQMTVTDDGQVVATYPLSAGSPTYPTQEGIHIALDKEPVVHMVSSTVGIPVTSGSGYDEYVYNDVHISDSGEYVHDAPWSEYAQGHDNVSHGCINLSSTDSKLFYDFSNVGDVVEIVNGTRSPVTSDHGVMDWTLDWSVWTPAQIAQA